MSVVANDNGINADVLTLIDRDVHTLNDILPMRQLAREAFAKTGLPENKNEEYKHLPITRLLKNNFNFQALSPASDVDASSFLIPGLDANLLVFVNGRFSEKHSKIVSGAAIEITLLADAIRNSDPVALENLGKLADVESDAFAAWNTAAWTNGVLIRVKDNAVLSQPIMLLHIHDAQQGQVVSLHRNLFVAGRNSEATVIEKYDSLGSHTHFSNSVTEVVVKENAGLHLYVVQADAGNRYHYGLTRVHQSNSSRVNTFTFTLSGRVVRNNLQFVLDGEGIESHMFGLYLTAGDSIVDNHTVVDHRKPNSFSNEIYKGVMDGSSKGIFNGKIYVRPQAQKTNAFQANRNILLSDSATVNTKPQLEIWADDVKCSHGCTSGQLDEEAMFYLQTRGISKDTARAMMLTAFASEILNNVHNAELKAYFEGLVDERLHQNI
jgi:Fe-S cluster assembly protein SufD